MRSGGIEIVDPLRQKASKADPKKVCSIDPVKDQRRDRKTLEMWFHQTLQVCRLVSEYSPC